MNEIKRVLAEIKHNAFVNTDDVDLKCSKETYRIMCDVLQAELDRQENKPLELSELKKMIGEPVWVEYSKRIITDDNLKFDKNIKEYIVLRSIEEELIISTDGTVKRYDKCNFYKYRPTKNRD